MAVRRQVAGRYQGTAPGRVVRVGQLQLCPLDRGPRLNPALVGGVVVRLQPLAAGQLDIGYDEVQL